MDKQTITFDGDEYLVMPHELTEGETLLELETAKWPAAECLHEHTVKCYIKLGCRNTTQRTYQPPSVVKSSHGRMDVCLDCHAVRAPFTENEWTEGVVSLGSEVESE